MKLLLNYALLMTLIVALMLCDHMQIDGDTAAVGVFSLAVGHGDDQYFPNHFYWTDYDPHTFTDLLVAVPLQIVSDYNPQVLKLTGFGIYLGLLAALVFAVRWAGGDWRRGALVLALVLSLAAPMTLFAMLVTFHNGVILLSLLYIILFYRIEERPHWQVGLLTVTGVAIVYSDMIFLALFVVPYTLYALVARKWPGLLLSIVFYISAGLSMLFKWSLGTNGIKAPGTTPPELILYNIITLPSNLVSVFFTSFWTAMTPANALLFVVVAFVYTYILLCLSLRLEGRSRYLAAMMGVGGFVMLAGYSLVGAFTLTRFLLYPALAVLVIASLAVNLDKWRKVRLALAVLLSATILLNLTYMESTESYNEDMAGLIDQLRRNNVDYGYAWFHVSDPITYLSKGDIKIVSAYPNGNGVNISYSLNEEHYIHNGGRGCIITYREPVWPYVTVHPVDYVVVSGDFTAYIYNDLTI